MRAKRGIAVTKRPFVVALIHCPRTPTVFVLNLHGYFAMRSAVPVARLAAGSVALSPFSEQMAAETNAAPEIRRLRNVAPGCFNGP
jgi:hypothetical protein